MRTATRLSRTKYPEGLVEAVAIQVGDGKPVYADTAAAAPQFLAVCGGDAKALGHMGALRRAAGYLPQVESLVEVRGPRWAETIGTIATERNLDIVHRRLVRMLRLVL